MAMMAVTEVLVAATPQKVPSMWFCSRSFGVSFRTTIRTTRRRPTRREPCGRMLPRPTSCACRTRYLQCRAKSTPSGLGSTATSIASRTCDTTPRSRISDTRTSHRCPRNSNECQVRRCSRANYSSRPGGGHTRSRSYWRGHTLATPPCHEATCPWQRPCPTPSCF